MKSENEPAAFVSVNSHVIRENARRLREGEQPSAPVAVRRRRSSDPEYPEGDVIITDAAGDEVGRVRYEPEGGLGCGARVFLELKYQPRFEKS